MLPELRQDCILHDLKRFLDVIVNKYLSYSYLLEDNICVSVSVCINKAVNKVRLTEEYLMVCRHLHAV